MTRPPSPRAGFTLVELLLVIVMLAAVMGATFMLFQSQSRAFRTGSNRYDLVQNARGAMELSERVIRTMGAGVTGNQPVLVYGSNTALAFNTDYIERDTVDMRWAAYFNADAPLDETVAWDVADAAAIPTSSPSYVYPTETYRLGNGAVSPAETYTLYFEADEDTPRADDYALWERVNNGTPQLLARSILPDPTGKPFFEYLMHRVLSSGDALIIATDALLPLIRRPLSEATSAADSNRFSRPDSVRAIGMNYLVSNGDTGSAERTRQINTVIEVPNNGIVMPTVCGRPPLPPGSLSATEVGVGLGEVQLTWTRSPDQDAGEVDARQYVIWRRPAAETLWDAPLLFVRAERDSATYATTLTDNVPGESYTFGVAVQDCTPSFSATVTTNITLSLPPAP